MSEYFQHPYISNSDIKNFLKQIGLKREDPPNLQAIFDLGTLIHSNILEPHLADVKHDQYQLACKMRDTFWKDAWCRDFISKKDFKREHEIYRTVEVGGMQFNSRCKCDGIRTGINVILELKGLNVETEKAFNDAITTFDYDQAAAHYILTANAPMQVIIGLSKKKPERLFRKIIKKHDNTYAEGEHKLIESLQLLSQYSPDDIKILV
jgi:hypothetical protein